MSHYPPNNGQPPNWQGNQPQYPPQYPWGLPPDQSGQWGQQQPQPPSWQPAQYNQPTQAWQPVPPPLLQRGGKPPRKPLTKRDKIIGVGCLGIILLLLCGIVGAIGNAVNAHNSTTATVPMTIVVIPSNTPTTTSVQAVLPTDTPTIAPTDTPVPSPTATPTPRPMPTPTQPIVQQPTPTQAPHCVAVNNNPWCYNFSPGNLIYSPASAFCSYFACVSTFWTDTNGYVAECANGKYTHSATVSGACSRDGGVSQILYSH